MYVSVHIIFTVTCYLWLVSIVYLCLYVHVNARTVCWPACLSALCVWLLYFVIITLSLACTLQPYHLPLTCRQ